jgi:NAD(P) transhydrogenase
MRQVFYERNNVDILHGHARSLDSHNLEVLNEKWIPIHTLSADYFVLAAGSRPYRPEDIYFTHPNIFDSDTILNLKKTPQSITVYGAGVIGCEYASIFRNLGIKVNLVNTR